MERRPRVAITLEQCWHEVPGGTARSALDSAEAVRRRGLVDQIGVSARHRSPAPAPWTPTIEVAALSLPRVALYESWHRLRRPRVESATGPVDVIHVTGMAVPPPSAPLVVTVHDLAFLREPSQFTRRGVSFFHRAIDLARRDATIVICPSSATIDECLEHGFVPDRLRLVPWGIDVVDSTPEAIAGTRARFGLDGDFVLWAGTIEPRKNLPVLLEAFDRFAPEGVTLVLAGPTGWNESIDHLVERLGDRVRPVGFVEPATLRALMAGAATFCFPSRQEGFGLPVLEAMAQGTAVITSAGTATEEVIGDAGIVVEPSDVDALGAALARVLDDDVERRRLGALASERARRDFTWDATAQRLESVYREAMR